MKVNINRIGLRSGVLEKFEKFEALNIEKQNEIINAAMKVFGSVGYKKAYISEIAEIANISKSMVFYYFGSKKDLYLYLLDLSFIEIASPFDREDWFVEKDFFKRIIWATEIKMVVLRKRPSIMKFLATYYFETDPEIFEEKKLFVAKSEEMQKRFAFTDIDYSKFKENVKPETVLKMLLRWTEGYISVLQNAENYQTDEEMEKFYDAMLTEFYECFEMLRQNLYREEFL